MGKRKTVWPTEREVRLRFILLAIIETASNRGVPIERLLLSYILLRNQPTQEQLWEAISDCLLLDEMSGFRFEPGSEADRLMRNISSETDQA
ncbi:hypothetical protein [Pseudomonas sp. AN3A02]|uniref:hypothetical protein n=1 Tax=Pseudomonas sp. AN3A02 TaxID=2719587 RepID=UPI00142FB70E|nr:hypothetical protein [Pseudomonas sp. AN3A02]NIL16584.1 hypothetical protein [Pseudomonas sp. AN3A02]